jgi:hypothetical protein
MVPGRNQDRRATLGDGRRLAVRRRALCEAGDLQQLVSPVLGPIRQMAWSPTGSQLLVVNGGTDHPSVFLGRKPADLSPRSRPSPRRHERRGSRMAVAQQIASGHYVAATRWCPDRRRRLQRAAPPDRDGRRRLVFTCRCRRHGERDLYGMAWHPKPRRCLDPSPTTCLLAAPTQHSCHRRGRSALGDSAHCPRPASQTALGSLAPSCMLGRTVDGMRLVSSLAAPGFRGGTGQRGLSWDVRAVRMASPSTTWMHPCVPVAVQACFFATSGEEVVQPAQERSDDPSFVEMASDDLVPCCVGSASDEGHRCGRGGEHGGAAVQVPGASATYGHFWVGSEVDHLVVVVWPVAAPAP